MSLQIEQDSDQLLDRSAAASGPPMSRWSQDGFVSNFNKRQGDQQRRNRAVSICMLVLTVTAVILSVVSLAVAVAKTGEPTGEAAGKQQADGTAAAAAAAWPQIKRIAFSSCTSYDLRPQPIWTEVRKLSPCCGTCVSSVLSQASFGNARIWQLPAITQNAERISAADCMGVVLKGAHASIRAGHMGLASLGSGANSTAMVRWKQQ
jgi:DNA-binding transcriptional regulator YdaS (Cro superfamily)